MTSQPKFLAPTQRQYSLRRPCKECPFAKSCPPGATGGSDPTVFIGQAVGPFILSCHTDDNYSNATALDNAEHLAQCAGAAIFRANVQVDHKMPNGLHRLAPDTNQVFATPADLIAHHKRITLREAEALLSVTPPYILLMEEIKKLGESNFFFQPGNARELPCTEQA